VTKQKLLVIALILPMFLVVDLLWIGVVMKGFYSQELGELARRQGDALAPRWGAALPVYLLIPVGIFIFVRPRLGQGATAVHAFGWGAAFGLVLYGVYDLSNLAVLEKWAVRMTLADIGWGCVLCGITAVVMRLLERRLTR
jgi:uncharacterized membrane protein